MAKKKKGKGGKEMLIVASKVRAHIKSKRAMTSSEFLPALNKAVYDMLDKAIERTKGNKRTTLRARDV